MDYLRSQPLEIFVDERQLLVQREFKINRGQAERFVNRLVRAPSRFLKTPEDVSLFYGDSALPTVVLLGRLFCPIGDLPNRWWHLLLEHAHGRLAPDLVAALPALPEPVVVCEPKGAIAIPTLIDKTTGVATATQPACK